jgi:hypothetical protein
VGRSAERFSRAALAGAVGLAGLGLAACETTQERNERVKLAKTRLVGGQEAHRVTRAGDQTEVTGVTVVRDATHAAVVVDVRNREATPLTDVPVTVGAVERTGRYRYLNTSRNLGWFRTHIAAVPPRGTATWVLRVPRGRIPLGSRPFARVGAPDPAFSSATALPSLRVTAGPRAGARARVRVGNGSDVPQTDVQVTALVRIDGRYVAAGTAAVAELDREASTEVAVPLTGRPGRGTLRVQAIPTIFG